MQINSATPYLRVQDMERSLDFYVRGLGFELVNSLSGEDGLFWARVERHACSLMLSHRPSRFIADSHADDDHEHDEHGRHVFRINATQNGELNLVTYLYVDDADAAYRELQSRGVATWDAPEDKFYGVREFLVRDPDGYYYAIAQLLG